MDPPTGDVEPISASVLAGGQSRRMGQDKALLRLGDDEAPMLQVVLDRLGTIATERFIVASGRPRYDQFAVPVIPDRYPSAATLGGIATALAVASNERCLVVGCDMPFLNRELMHWMMRQAPDADIVIPVLPGESRQGSGMIYQTLHAIYRRTCLPAIERQLATGQRQVVRFFSEMRVHTIDSRAIERLDPDLRSFFNANTPEALDMARQMAREEKDLGASV